MVSQATAVRTKSTVFSKDPSENRSPPWHEEPDSPVLVNLHLHTPEANGRGKGMDLGSQDKVNDVISKLETLKDLFAFYACAHRTTGFSEESIVGLGLIIRDCITGLEEVVSTDSE